MRETIYYARKLEYRVVSLKHEKRFPTNDLIPHDVNVNIPISNPKLPRYYSEMCEVRRDTWRGRV